MKNAPKIRNTMLLAALAAVTATAWATGESLTGSKAMPYPDARAESRQLAIEREPIAVRETLSPNETVVEERQITVAPAAQGEAVYGQQTTREPRIVVEEPRLTLDERIHADVMERLARADLSGRIGVESRDAVVTLTGYTVTRGQSWRAERAAGSVEGVRYVQNRIQPRIGGSV